ncbi:GH12 family glycosyl hydrolase domain-containing protein [Amycolatopsis sp. 3B14]|uniref:GH12 family glycosyl hydrolase domain-containing protein n=1 Tax=Amycolatopsis sp. 3B14 TaxID=3243600 RepID=UPI003D982BD8
MKRTLPAVLLAAPLVLLSAAACDPGSSWATQASRGGPAPSSSASSAPGTTSAEASSTTSTPPITSSTSSKSSSTTPRSTSATSTSGTSTSGTSTSAASTPAPEKTCADPVFTTSDPDGGWSDGGYYVHNNMWNQDEAGPETLHACAHDNWYVDSTQPDSTSVKTYPNVHKDINNLDGAPLSDYSTITSTFAGRGPATGIYDVAYDIWLNGVGQQPGVTELMVWTENHNQVPSGEKVATYTAGGVTYDVWANGSGYLAFVAQSTQYSGNIDIKAMIDWSVGRGYIPPNPTVNQLGYGIEFCSTGGVPARFTVSDFSVTMN